MITAMNTPQQQQQATTVEERIGTATGKIIVLALIAFLLWGYSTAFLGQLGLL
jgi:hypothetical protein